MFNTNFNIIKGCRQHFFLLILLLLMTAPRGWSQGITLIEYPFLLVDQNNSIRVSWSESISATLYYGSQHGQFNRQISRTGTRLLEFTPVSEGIAPGIYYCRVSNGLVHSSEFTLVIESPQAPVGRAPLNGEVITTISPRFQWDAVPGVPFYHFFISDQPVKLSRDSLGSLQVEGANIIYQVITSQTEITYGQPDPSGYFNQSNGIVPPLLNGKAYNWIVLNNYGNNPALSSIVQSGVQSFSLNVAVNLSPPVLVAPAQTAQIATEEIEFTWQPVTNTKSYQFELFEFLQQEGSTSTYQVWQVVTTGTSVRVPARTVCKNSYYEWQVIALDVAGKGAVSNRRNFTYTVPTGSLTINSRTNTGQSLPRINIQLKPIQGNGENTKYLTSDSGILTLNVQPGTYELKGMKFGFRDTTVTVSVEVNRTLTVVLYMAMLPRTVSGSIVDQSGSPLPNAQIIAYDALQENNQSMISDFNGKFRLPLPPSIYQIYAVKSGYSPSTKIQVDLKTQVEVNLTTPLTLIRSTGKLLGKVINQTGVPIFGALVTARLNENQIVTSSDVNGAFQLTLASGSWQLSAQKVGYSQNNLRTVSIAENQTINLTPDLILNSQAGLLSGLVTDGRAGVEQVAVRAVPPQANSVQTFSNPKGQFSLSLSAGTYDLFFHREGFVDPLPRHFELQPGQSITNLIINLVPANVEISGLISGGGQPLAGAIVSNGMAADTSRLNGFYRLLLPPGSHRITVTKTGYYQAQPEQISLSAGQVVTNHNFNLSSQAAGIKGRILSGSDFVVNASVLAVQAGDTVTILSKNDGTFSFSLSSGIWKVIARKNGFQENSLADIALQPGQTIEGIELVLLLNSGVITGRVNDAQGNGIAEALVVCLQRQIQTSTDASGQYRLQLSPGTFTFTASKVGYGEQSKSATIVSNQTQTVHFSLSRTGTVTGNILDPQGTPINWAEVLAIQGSDTNLVYSDYTGFFRFYLPGGNYLLRADKLGYAASQQNINLQNGQTFAQNFQLQFQPNEIAKISGRITVDNQFSLTGVLLKVSGRINKATQTSLDGSFNFENLETGYNYTIEPTLGHYFFLPPRRSYQPLTANKVDQNYLASFYGDVSSNQEISAFDGSLVLRISAKKVVSPYFSNFPRDSLAADVSGNRTISSFDASLIFRYAVGLITQFPAEDKTVSPAKTNQSEQAPVAVYYHQDWSEQGKLKLVLFSSEALSFFALDAELRYPVTELEPLAVLPAQPLTGFYREWQGQNGNLTIAIAGVEKAQCQDTLLVLLFRTLNNDSPATVSLTWHRLELDEGALPVILSEEQTIPRQFYVSQNYPNPFNQSTIFQVNLPQINDESATRFQVAIYNLLGQKIKSLSDRVVVPGFYTLQWLGDSDDRRALASGIYLIRVEYAQFHAVQKMVLIR